MQTRPFIAFDLEIAREIPEGKISDWHLGITCAATFDSKPRVWFPKPDVGDRVPYPDCMSVRECCALLQYLVEQSAAGYDIVTWNGMGFDFRVLAAECHLDLIDWDNLVDLAWGHIDIAFNMLCDRGFMAGLNKATKGMGLSGKKEGMSGALAPAMWQEGRVVQEKVLEYVAQDAQATAELYQAIIAARSMTWITMKGVQSNRPWEPAIITDLGGQRLMTVTEANNLRQPNTSWMDKPRKRSEFTSWASTKALEKHEAE